MSLPVRRVEWKPCRRIIPSRFPPVELFERVADLQDYDAVKELESLTNPRLRGTAGAGRPLRGELAGRGASVIMAPFAHPNPDGSRFSDGGWGAFYAAKDLDTAIAETRHHRERFMRATGQPGMELEMRVYAVDLEGDLHDLRGRKASDPLVYHSDDYAQARQLARALRNNGSEGVVYDSVRHDGGECAAVFHPSPLSNARQSHHLCYVWSGERIVNCYVKRPLKGLPGA